MPSNDAESKWDIFKQVMFFPRFICFGIPLIIFMSLFFIPEGYTGFTQSSKTMNGTYQNKWLFDCIYTSVLIVFMYIHINAFFNTNYHQYRYKLASFLDKPNSDKPDGDPKVFKIIFYVFAVLCFIAMNVGAPDGSRWTGEWNRLVFINFFFYMGLFYFVLLGLGMMSFMSKEDISQGRRMLAQDGE